MPFTVEVYSARSLAIASCAGLVREAEIQDAIEFSFGSGAVPGGIDRVVRIESTADLHELDAEALRRIQVHMREASDATGGALPKFRSVLIALSPSHRYVAELYKALWDSDQLPGVDFSVVTTVAEAAMILGPPGLGRSDRDDLRAMVEEAEAELAAGRFDNYYEIWLKWVLASAARAEADDEVPSADQ